MQKKNIQFEDDLEVREGVKGEYDSGDEDGKHGEKADHLRQANLAVDIMLEIVKYIGTHVIMMILVNEFHQC